MEREWKNLQKALVETAENDLPEKAKMTRQPWMTQDILSLMDERRKWKINTVKYRELDKEIKKKCRKRKEEWILKKCGEIEDLEKTHSPRVYEKIRKLGSKKRDSRNNIIKRKMATFW